MLNQVIVEVSAWATTAWQWAGWDRVADIATVVTAVATASIAVSLGLNRWAQMSAIERYLKDVARTRGPTEQGLRTAENISRKLDIPLDDVKRLAHASRKVVSRIRPNGPDQEHTLVWGYRGAVPKK